MNPEHKHLRAIVRGRVQGVSFRYYTQAQALRLRLTGWVRNRPDGSVEVAAEGPRADLDQLLAWLHHWPPAARVADVQAEWLAAGGALGPFDIH